MIVPLVRSPARVQVAGADRAELPARRRRLPVVRIRVPAPAGDRAIRAQSAGVISAGRDGAELPARDVASLAVEVVAPASDGSIGLQSARMPPAAGHRSEPTARRDDLAVAVPAPAGRGAIAANGARVRVAGGHRPVRPPRRVRLTMFVLPPAVDGVVAPQPARMETPRIQSGEADRPACAACRGARRGLGGENGDGRARQPASERRRGGEHARRRQQGAAPRAVGEELPQRELDLAVGELPGHDAHLHVGCRRAGGGGDLHGQR